MRSPIFTPLALIAVGLALIVSSPLRAGASNKNGNPFGNGTYFQTTGTFSAVIRGENLSGTMLFSSGVSTNSSATNSSSGSCVISYLGSPDGTIEPGVYNGNAAGMWDPSSGNISGQFWGSYPRSGTNSFTNWSQALNTNHPLLYTNYSTNGSIISITTNYLPNVTIAVVSNSTESYTNTNTGSTYSYTYSSTNVLYIEPYGSNAYNDAAMMNGSFNGTIENKYPNQTFTAQGSISQKSVANQQQGTNASIINSNGTTNYNQEGTLPIQLALTSNIPVTVQGLRISDAYSDFSTVSNSIPYALTTYGITNVPNQQGGW
jgi:hypothetical protein